ncbi:uncharacterized protein LOC131429204 [Malaya genurostris]|uniref:uncharacterized protein LOC131429204 n=1 Tax=Malaya genurostris TaxID=325434 RepID=UPI0026F3B201|nr:uncharacterized protein LOC131429204 [Malaya genurostris]
MKASISLGIIVLFYTVVMIFVEVFGSEINDKRLVPAEPFLAPTASIPNISKQSSNHVLNGAKMYEHQHEKREAVTQPSTIESLQADLQQHLRDRKFYVGEPRYIFLRQPESDDDDIAFIPQRGRKSDQAALLEKRDLSIRQMLAGGDYFVPNRGKKQNGNGITKKIKFDDILGPDDFIPNRGKKEYYNPFVSAFGQGRAFNDLPASILSKKNVLTTIQNVSSKEGNREELFYPTRGKKNILDNLSSNQDTFFSSRGRRNPIIWSILSEELDPWDYGINDGDANDAASILDRYQINKIIQ